MAGHVLTLIPELLGHVPEPEARERGVAAARRLVPHARCEARVLDSLALVDGGEEPAAVLCPTCGEELGRGFWEGELASARAGGFERLAVTTPCGHPTTLHDLRWVPPRGFSRFVLELADLDDLSLDGHEQIEAAVGCRLRPILRA